MTAAELFNARFGRVEDAIQLKVPDRVPVLTNFRYFASKYAGLTAASAFYDAEGWMAANKKVILDFQPDLYYAPLTDSGKAYEILGLKQVRWPGHGVPVNASHQFVEGEYMKADEYDKFLEDASEYALTTYLPRLCAALEPLSSIPSFKTLLFGNPGLIQLAVTLARPEVEQALQSLIRASIGRINSLSPEKHPGTLPSSGLTTCHRQLSCPKLCCSSRKNRLHFIVYRRTPRWHARRQPGPVFQTTSW